MQPRAGCAVGCLGRAACRWGAGAQLPACAARCVAPCRGTGRSGEKQLDKGRGRNGLCCRCVQVCACCWPHCTSIWTIKQVFFWNVLACLVALLCSTQCMCAFVSLTFLCITSDATFLQGV